MRRLAQSSKGIKKIAKMQLEGSDKKRVERYTQIVVSIKTDEGIKNPEAETYAGAPSTVIKKLKRLIPAPSAFFYELYKNGSAVFQEKLYVIREVPKPELKDEKNVVAAPAEPSVAG